MTERYERVDKTWSELKDILTYPVSLYRKENGFLGIVSSRNGELYICSKSTNRGDYAGWFKELLYKSVNDIVAFNKYLADNKVSAIFEVIDIDRDPHIITYPNSHIVLLDIVKNNFKNEFLPYEELCNLAAKFGVQCKYWICNANDFNQLKSITEEIRHWDMEGYVAVDAKGFMFKFKTNGYKCWKQIRAIRDKIVLGKDVSNLITDNNKHVVDYMKQYANNNGLDVLKNLSIPQLREKYESFRLK